MIGIRAVSGRSRSASTTSKPFTDGIMRSSTMSPGSSCARDIDRLLTAVRSQDRGADRREPNGDQLHGFGVVVHHQRRERLARPPGRTARAAPSESYSSFRVTGFCITAAAPSAKPLREVRDDRDDHHRHVPQRRHLLDSAEKLPAVHLRQRDVERDQRQRLLRLRAAAPSSADAACSTVNPSASSCTRIRPADVMSSSTTSAVRVSGRACDGARPALTTRRPRPASPCAAAAARR